MSRLNVFVKANGDVRDSLICARIGGQVLWNGINELIRHQFPGRVARVRHEVLSRSDALLECSGSVPQELSIRNPKVGPYTLESQFSRQVFEAAADVVVLSIQPDVTARLVRSRKDGFLFYPNDWEPWIEADRLWLRESFRDGGVLEARESMNNFRGICNRIRQHGNPHILIYNLSSVVPGEHVHCHQGLGEILSTRIRRFNLGLAELSAELGISVVDVDQIVARSGADRLKVDAVHLGAEGHRLVAQEVVNILSDLGSFDLAG